MKRCGQQLLVALKHYAVAMLETCALARVPTWWC
jgi:hypothetical protein